MDHWPASGERVLWQGRPTGLPHLSRILPVCVVLLTLAMVPAGVGCFLAVACSDISGLPRPAVSFGPATVQIGTQAVPGGPSVGLVACAAFSLWRLAAWRARRFTVTDARVMVTNGYGRALTHLVKADYRLAWIVGRDLHMDFGGPVGVFEQLEDPEAALSALETWSTPDHSGRLPPIFRG